MSNKTITDKLPDIRQKAELLGVTIKPEQLEQLQAYLALLIAYNEHTNLVATADVEILVSDHVLDSLTVLPLVYQCAAGKSAVKIVDLGSGAGFPGLVLALADENFQVTLIESVGKKAHFLESVVNELGLGKRVFVYCQRAEVVARLPDIRAAFDIATARAVASFDIVAELAFPCLSLGGYLLCQKSLKQLDAERQRAAIAMPILGGVLESVVNVDKNVVDKDHVIMVAKKIAATTNKFPRLPAQIKKLPLGGN